MALFSPTPLLPDALSPDPEKDIRRAQRIGQYKISSQAVYFAAFPGTVYLPLSAVREAFHWKRQMTAVGCCGKSVLIPAVVLRYGEKAQRILDFHSQKQAELFLHAVFAGYPQLQTGKMK